MLVALSPCGPVHPKHKFQHLLYLGVLSALWNQTPRRCHGQMVSAPRAAQQALGLGQAPLSGACRQGNFSFSIPAAFTAALFFIFLLAS